MLWNATIYVSAFLFFGLHPENVRWVTSCYFQWNISKKKRFKHWVNYVDFDDIVLGYCFCAVGMQQLHSTWWTSQTTQMLLSGSVRSQSPCLTSINYYRSLSHTSLLLGLVSGLFLPITQSSRSRRCGHVLERDTRPQLHPITTRVNLGFQRLKREKGWTYLISLLATKNCDSLQRPWRVYYHNRFVLRLVRDPSRKYLKDRCECAPIKSHQLRHKMISIGTIGG